MLHCCELFFCFPILAEALVEVGEEGERIVYYEAEDRFLPGEAAGRFVEKGESAGKVEEASWSWGDGFDRKIVSESTELMGKIAIGGEEAVQICPGAGVEIDDVDGAVRGVTQIYIEKTAPAEGF